MKEWTSEQIKDFRISNGLIQKALGEMAGVSKITILQWERGERRPSKTAKILLSRIESDFNKEENKMPTLRTWKGKSEFKYEGNPLTEGTKIYYGKDGKYTYNICVDHYRHLINHFRGRRVPIGTAKDMAPENSVGAWLQGHVTQTALASYVGPILIRHGFAKQDGSDIEFY